jgi:hypothetical protein
MPRKRAWPTGVIARSIGLTLMPLTAIRVGIQLIVWELSPPR